MKMKTLLLSAIFFMTISLLGCGESTEEYFPLREGARWTYDSSFNTENGTEVRWVTDRREFNGNDWWVVSNRSDTPGMNGTTETMYRHSSHGLLAYTEFPIVAEALMIPATIDPDYSWVNSMPSVDNATFGALECKVGPREDVLLGNQTYTNTLKIICEIQGMVNSKSVKVIQTSWYAKGVGLIKFTSIADAGPFGGSVNTTLSLSSSEGL